MDRRLPGDHRRDRGTEIVLQRGQRVRGVFHRVVQDRGTQHLIIDLAGLLEPGQDRCDRNRVSGVRITAVAQLTLMAPGRDITGPPDRLDSACGRLVTMTARNPARRALQGASASAAGLFTMILPASGADAAMAQRIPPSAAGTLCLRTLGSYGCTCHADDTAALAKTQGVSQPGLNHKRKPTTPYRRSITLPSAKPITKGDLDEDQLATGRIFALSNVAMSLRG